MAESLFESIFGASIFGARQETQRVPAEYTLVDCVKCGVRFLMPTALANGRRKSGENFWCPNGHALAYGKPKAAGAAAEKATVAE